MALKGPAFITGPVRVSGGTIVANSSMPGIPFTLAGGTLNGNGTVGPITNATAGGVINPGLPKASGILHSGDAVLGTTIFQIELRGPLPGSDYDQLAVQGIVNLTGTPLRLTNMFAPVSGQTFIIIDNDGSDAIVGTFASQPQNSMLTNNGAIFQISYTGGDGNDVMLTRVLAAPASTIQFSGVNSNGLFNLSGLGIPNAPYVLEASPHIVPPIPWQPILTNNSDGTGIYQFIDAASTNFPIRFYRVLSP